MYSRVETLHILCLFIVRHRQRKLMCQGPSHGALMFGKNHVVDIFILTFKINCHLNFIWAIVLSECPRMDPSFVLGLLVVRSPSRLMVYQEVAMVHVDNLFLIHCSIPPSITSCCGTLLRGGMTYDFPFHSIKSPKCTRRLCRVFKVGAVFERKNCFKSLTKSGHSMHTKALLKAFLLNVSENDCAMMRETPAYFKEVAACSRLDPQPKFDPPTKMSP